MNQISRSSEIVRMVSDGSFTEIIELIRDNLEKSRYVEPQWFNLLHTSATNFEANLKTQIGDEITERLEEKIAAQQLKLNSLIQQVKFLEKDYTIDQVEFLEQVALSGYVHGPFGIKDDKIKCSIFDALQRGYPNEKKFKDIIARIGVYSMVGYDGLMTNAMLASHCDKARLEGAFVETGCWRGGSAAALAAVNLLYGRNRRELFLFDSFEGLPFPDRTKDTVLSKDWFENQVVPDMDGRDGELTPCKALTGASIDDVTHIVNDVIGYPKECTHIIQGWFQNTVPIFARENKPIAILRLDGDLYHSTMVPLRELYPQVVSGGFIIIDDYGYQGARQAVTDYFDAIDVKIFPNIIDRESCYFIKP